MSWQRILELMIHSDDPSEWFKKWKGMLASIITILIIAAEVLTAIGCCIILCVKSLTQKLTEATINEQMSMTYQQNNSLLLKVKLDSTS